MRSVKNLFLSEIANSDYSFVLRIIDSSIPYGNTYVGYDVIVKKQPICSSDSFSAGLFIGKWF